MHERRYFGTDGIRDVANQGNLTTDKVLRIGHAIGRALQESAPSDSRQSVLIVRDTRISGPMISGILASALMAHGVDVLDGGVLPTPAASLLVRRRQFAMAVVVSASHNPVADNGIKIFGGDGRKLSDEMEVEIERRIELEGSRDVNCTGADVGRKTPFREGEDLYLEAMVQDLFPHVDLSDTRLVIDCAHGSCSRISPRVLSALGADVTPVNCSPDGLNINDNAGVFFAEDLAAIVSREDAHLGMAMDGDGDRVILVDEQGSICDGDIMLNILARCIPEGETRQIVATVMSNMGLHVALREAGVELHQTPVGDRYVAEKMESTGSRIGGEQSGHIIFSNEHGWFGDGLYTALSILEVMLSQNRTLSELSANMERFPQVLENVEVSEKPPLSEISALQDSIREGQLLLGDDGRILVRYSGTENLARVMVEGRKKTEIMSVCSGLVEILQSQIGV